MLKPNHIGGTMTFEYTLSVRVNPKTNKIAFAAFPAKHAALRSNSKDWLTPEFR